MSGKILLADLAREAGCSAAQASRAVTGKPNVAPEVRTRVLEAARRLNYRNTARNHHPRIAILTNNFTFFPARLLQLLRDETAKLGWEWQAVSSRNLRQISEYFCDGVISLGDDDFVGRKWSGLTHLPLVIINGYGLTSENICSVDPDPYDGSRLGLEHLAGLGHRRIVRVCGVPDGRSELGQHRGAEEFFAAAADLELTEAENVEFHVLVPLDQMLPPLLDRGFTAIYMIHQHLAVAAAHAILRTGRRIPEDVSLVTYEVPKMSAFLEPPHTTLDFNCEGLVRRALRELQLRMRGGEVRCASSIQIPCKLNIRESTGPVAP